MDDPDIRWKQRFQNFEKAVNHLEKAATINQPTEVERAGIIQFYEVAFELAWETLKDYLTEAGYDIKSPRETIKQSFQNEYIEDGHKWLAMLEKRNELAHLYDEAKVEEALQLIQNSYVKQLLLLYHWMKKQL